MSIVDGCEWAGLPRSTFYRISKGYTHYVAVAVPVPQRDRYQPAGLGPEEIQAIADLLGSDDYQDLSVCQIYWRALDADQVYCSESTFYRVARRYDAVGDRRKVKMRTGGGTTSRRKPIVHAKKVGDLWSWDITELKGPGGHRYKLYLVMDVFSRYPVAWRIEYTEDTGKVIEMFADAFGVHGVPSTLHSDNGASMRANALADALVEAGVIASFSRPRVSDDNPFSESLFKTIKYDLGMPDHFDSIEHARAWATEFFHRYATEHRHSGIGHYTPESVHNGTAHQDQQRRQASLDKAYAEHPNRFNRRPKAPALPQPTGINTKLSQAA